MTSMSGGPFTTAFVTGATGLLGNNLVRELVATGIRVKGLARSVDKARAQFHDLPKLEIIRGDLADVAPFAADMRGCDVLFHTAAYFRDGYKGGSHADALNATNIDGTRRLIEAAYSQGVRRMVHTSSIAVLDGPAGAPVDETMSRSLDNADDYYTSKILSERAVSEFLDHRPDFHACFVLPGWMHGPGDAGPTSAGATVLEYLKGKLPGVPPASFSVVDARDVALIQIAAAQKGARGERYLAAGRHMTMAEVYAALERVSGVPAPTRAIPLGLLRMLAVVGEVQHRLTGKPALISSATVKLMAREAGRTQFNHSKTEQAFGTRFRPTDESFAAEIEWYRRNGWLEDVKLPTVGALAKVA
jgi:dihydroflavonol-4-reductase